MNTKQLSEKLYREILKGTFDCKVKVGGSELDPWHVVLRDIILSKKPEDWGYTKEEAEELLRGIAEKLVAGITADKPTWEMVKAVADKELGSG